MATSIFDVKEQQPDEIAVEKVLNSHFKLWEHFIEYLDDKYGGIEKE